MKYVYVFLVMVLASSCSPSSTTVVVPVSTFSITFLGKTYNESSDATHPITASFVLKTDQYFYNRIMIATVTANTKDLNTSFEGQKNDISSGTGSYNYVGIRNNLNYMYSPYTFIDKNNYNQLYLIDSLSSFSFTQADSHTITGFFNLKLHYINAGLGIDTLYPASGNITYNLFYGSH